MSECGGPGSSFDHKLLMVSNAMSSDSRLDAEITLVICIRCGKTKFKPKTWFPTAAYQQKYGEVNA